MIKPFKILVCGGRDYNNARKIKTTLDAIVAHYKLNYPVIIHGRAGGTDLLVRWWATARQYQDHGYPAQWLRYGNTAGPIRNQQMLDEEVPDLVVHFPGGSGTTDMVKRATKGGFKVIEAVTWQPE